jgi:hypothetical protein
MIDLVLWFVIAGTCLLALTIDFAALVGWLRRHWNGER